MNITVLKSVAIGLGFMILGGLVLLGYGVVQQVGKLKGGKETPSAVASAPDSLKPFGVLELQEPAGTEILEMATGSGRLFLRLGGGGRAERITVLDSQTNDILGTIAVVPSAPAASAAPAATPPEK